MNKDEALKLALKALESLRPEGFFNEAITAIKEALAQPEQDNTYGYASRLATAIWQKHYMKESPRFALLDTTEGVLTQIDNMTCGLVREKQAQPEQEPVAWMHTKLDGVVVPHRPADLSRHPDRWEALYKTPPPCPTCEALARTVMLDQTYHDNISPQRKPLTDEEIRAIDTSAFWNDHTALDFARAIEAAHGIKE